MTAKALVITGYGINCEEETAHAFELVGFETKIRHINDLADNPKELNNIQAMSVPGGFSYGDDTGSGNAFAQKMRLTVGDALKEFVERDTLTIGICNGCQVVVNLGLAPAFNNQYGVRQVAVTHNASARYQCRWIDLKVEKNNSPWLQNIDRLHVPVAHGEGRFMMADETLEALKKNNQIALRYAKLSPPLTPPLTGGNNRQAPPQAGGNKTNETFPSAHGGDKPAKNSPTAHGGDKPAKNSPTAHGGDKPAKNLPPAGGGDKPARNSPTAHGGDKPARNLPPAGGGDRGGELIPANGEFPFNPNGSTDDIAGITNKSGRVLVLMPHPERGMFTWQRDDYASLKDQARRDGKTLPNESDGLQLFQNAASYFGLNAQKLNMKKAG